MNYALSILTVIFYGTIILWFLWRRRKEKPSYLLWCVAMGLGSALLALLLEYGWHLLFTDWIEAHSTFIFLESFIGVSLVEESAKWLWLILIIRRWRAFVAYVDGILFACGIAAGFNLFEGLLYAYTEQELSSVVVRGLTAVPMHFLFAVVMGFLFARFKMESRRFLWFSLFIPVILHGLYDFFIFQQFTEALMGGAIVVLLGCLLLSLWICRTAIRADEMRLDRREALGS